MDTDRSKAISRRIEKRLGFPSLTEKLTDDISSSDLSSLLTEVFASRAEHTAPHELLKQYAQNQYAKPACCDAVQYRLLEADMLLAAQNAGVRSVILSPAALLGCCSVFGAVSQNKVISATRNLEMVSDATNMLALHIAAGIKAGAMSHANGPIHLCATHRHVRYQPAFADGMLPHFGIFTMVSAGRSQSSYAFEIESMLLQLRFYRDYWLRRHGTKLTLSVNPRAGYKDAEGFITRIVSAVRDNLPDMELSIDNEVNNTAYYKGLQATLNAKAGDSIIEIGDIGFTDWTRRLLNSPGERLLISAMALDRQM